MIYIIILGATQLGEQLCTGTATNYGKFNSAVLAAKPTAYQKFMDKISAPSLPIWISWWTMEQPAFWVPLSFQVYSLLQHGLHSGHVFLLMMQVHYFQRSFIFPCLSRGRPFPVLHWLMAFIFCTCNGTLQA